MPLQVGAGEAATSARHYVHIARREVKFSDAAMTVLVCAHCMEYDCAHSGAADYLSRVAASARMSSVDFKSEMSDSSLPPCIHVRCGSRVREFRRHSIEAC